MYNIGFIIEQALGHITHTGNLRVNVPLDGEVRSFWGLIPFETTGIAGKIPLYKSNWTVRAGLRARRAVADIARQTRLDALFFHTQVPAVLASDWIRRIPSIVSLDATPIQYDQLGQFYNHSQGSPLLEKFKWRLNRACFYAARHLVTWSAWARQGLIEGYGVPGEKITVIPPGVNTASWTRPTARPRRSMADTVKILFVGGDLERKGGLLLLEAFRALRDDNLELHLVTRDRVAPEPGLFVYNSMQPNSPELKRLYHDSDIFCMPTYGDCLPMVLSEAGAASLPTVTTHVAAIPEIVRDGETGFLIPPGNIPLLTTALKRLIQQPDLRLHMGEQAAAHVTREYDARKNTERLLALLKYEADAARMMLGNGYAKRNPTSR